MDDSYDIDRVISKLCQRGKTIDEAAEIMGMYTNERKTCVARLDKGFICLQRKIRLREDGSIEYRLRPKAVTRIKRRIRKLKWKADSGKISPDDVANMVRSWLYARRDCLNYPQLRRIELLTLEVYGADAYAKVYDHSDKWRCNC